MNDIVYFIKLNKEERRVYISKYLVTDSNSMDSNAEFIKCDKVSNNEDIRKLHFNSRLENEVMEYLRKVKLTLK